MKPKQIKVAVMAAAALIAFAAGLGMGLGLGVDLGTPAPSAPSGRAICAVNPCRVIMTRNGRIALTLIIAAGAHLAATYMPNTRRGLTSTSWRPPAPMRGSLGDILL